MYEPYWRKMGHKCDIPFSGDDSLSYFANGKSLCWFLESKLEEQIKRMHNVVGNAIVDDHYIVVGTGSSQLVQAALYVLSPSDQLEPISVVSATPFYSAYPNVTDFVRSRLHKWARDAKTFEKYGPYIELITSPNNPNEIIREPVVNGDQGKLIFDLAYYWPQYTAITLPANHDVMLFTISKCTGHAGSRIGWALVKDKEVARKLTKFMEIRTIGVSKETQLRAAKILEVVSNSCLDFTLENFFKYSQSLMIDRWQRLRQVVMDNDLFVIQNYPPQYCLCAKDLCESHLGGEEEDCEKLLKEHKIQTRSGRRFGSDSRNARIKDSQVSEVSRYYRKLSVDFVKAGLFKKKVHGVMYLFCFIRFLLFLTFYAIIFSGNYLIHMLFGALSGLTWMQISYLVRDSGHYLIMKNKGFNEMIQIMSMKRLFRIHITWWKCTHNAHYVACNSLDYDPDLQNLPVLIVSSSLFKSLNSTFYGRQLMFDPLEKFFVSYQHFTCYPIFCVSRVNLFVQPLLLLFSRRKVPDRLLNILGNEEQKEVNE
uniref:Alliin lyase n=1 Tax=Solanum tuberosum TaxID=4113 RepID=M1BMT0_SOLTU